MSSIDWGIGVIKDVTHNSNKFNSSIYSIVPQDSALNTSSSIFRPPESLWPLIQTQNCPERHFYPREKVLFCGVHNGSECWNEAQNGFVVKMFKVDCAGGEVL